MKYSEEQLVRIARREKNTKRSYLVVNRLQGKHVPVCPDEAFAMFLELAALVRKAYQDERLLLIGFAETATAIGAALAVELNTLYMQTTREEIPGVEYLYFSESHSHATEQKLVRDDIDRVVDETDRIVFVEDEVTTGNTILKIIDLLEKRYPGKSAFGVASLLNGMDEKALNTYADRGISLQYLVKTQHGCYTEIAGRYRGDGVYVEADLSDPGDGLAELTVPGWMNARRCVLASDYRKACENLWISIRECGYLTEKKKVLVTGTEEFMYPALYVAGRLQEQGKTVKCHSTTRSPIEVSSEEEYPLHRRYELRSLYEDERRTFLYDPDRYDGAVILTDAQNNSRTGINTLVHALRSCGNEEILLVRWCQT